MTARIQNANIRTKLLLEEIDWVSGGRATVKVHRNLVVEKFVLIADGNLIATYDGTGTNTKPVVNRYGIMGGLIEEAVVSRQSSDKLKVFKGVRHMNATIERMFGAKDPALCKSNASDFSGSVLQGLPVFPATTQKMPFREYAVIMMANGISNAPFPSLFSTKGLDTATLNLRFSDISKVRDPNDTSTAVISTDGIKIKVYAICIDHLLDNQDLGKVDFYQAPQELQIAGAASRNKEFLSPDPGLLQGLYVTAIHSDGRFFDLKEMESTKLEFSYLGVDIADGSMADYLDLDSVETHLSNRHLGTCYINLRDSKMFQSGLPIARGEKLEVRITTASGISYPATLIFEYDILKFDPLILQPDA